MIMSQPILLLRPCWLTDFNGSNLFIGLLT
uniref:Uncharacterized protein n=1 Tax=Rhizophora mucronata TaxID=61149 RepID=A0A2P2J0L4_RHIMU